MLCWRNRGISAPTPPLDPRPKRTMMDMGMNMSDMKGMKMEGMQGMDMSGMKGMDMSNMKSMQMSGSGKSENH